MIENIESLRIPREDPWTKEQWDAITTRHCNLLVSAAAGTGKTAVLVRRIIFLLTHPEEPIDIDEFLIVTFTHAAAAEMRDRISQALEKELDSDPTNTRLSRQLALISKADISTLHSFCYKVIKQYFYRLGIDPAFRVIDDTENQLLQLEVIDALFEDYYDDINFEEEFTSLIQGYGGRYSDENVKDSVLRVYNFSRSRPDPDSWLSQLSAMFSIPDRVDIKDLPWSGLIFQGISRRVSAAYRCLGRALEIAHMPFGPNAYLELLKEEFEFCRKIVKACETKDWKGISQFLNALKFLTLPRIKKGECDDDLKNQVQTERNEGKRILKDLQDRWFFRPPEELINDIRSASSFMNTFIHIIKGFGRAYEDAKREKNLMDFSDMEHLCLKILREWDNSTKEWKVSDVAKELQRKYKEVLVDEYQDINPVQNEILQFVSSEDNSFMVGDVKQSIYRFRLAEPKLFMDKHRKFSKDCTDSINRRIDLSRNFRSRQPIINSVNFIFRQIFSEGVGEVVYDRDAELVHGANYPPYGPEIFRGDCHTPPVEVYFIDRSAANSGDNDLELDDISYDGEPEDMDALEVEARFIACRILEMVKGTTLNPGPEFQVWDKRKNAYRPVSFRDIVILMRTTRGRANTLLEVFRRANIPSYAELGTGYFEAVEIETMLALLQIIDNPRQDIPLAGVLRSPIGRFTNDELAKIRLCDRENDFYHALETAVSCCTDKSLASKVKNFLEKLDYWRTIARRVPLSILIWQLYRDTRYLDYVSGMPGGTQRQANLKAFHERARQFDRFSRQGLVRFLRFINKLREVEGDLGTARALGEAEDVVRIMSVHKSKGLEFPIVFIPDMGKQFNLKDLRYDILFHSEAGLGPMYSDPIKRIKYPTLPYHAVKEGKLREAISEEMRILYVAMTRARERLIMLGSDKKLKVSISRWCSYAKTLGWGLPEPVLYSAGKFLDWVGPSLIRHKEGYSALGVKDDIGYSINSEIYNDSARFAVKLLSPAEVCSRFEDITVLGSKKADIDWDLITCALPLGRQVDVQFLKKINAYACWDYPHNPLTERAAKVGWAEIKGRFDFSNEDADINLGGAKFKSESKALIMPLEKQLLPRPEFLQNVNVTPRSRGEAVHLVIQHLDLSCPLEISDIEDSIERMVNIELLSQELAGEIDVQCIYDFFKSPLGIRMKTNPDMVMREVPFSLGIPALRVYPELLQYEKADSWEERVLVQGIIDCIVNEKDGFILIDFKTGGKPWEDPVKIAHRYKGQISVYKEAIETIYNKPVKEAYIYLLNMRKGILM